MASTSLFSSRFLFIQLFISCDSRWREPSFCHFRASLYLYSLPLCFPQIYYQCEKPCYRNINQSVSQALFNSVQLWTKLDMRIKQSCNCEFGLSLLQESFRRRSNNYFHVVAFFFGWVGERRQIPITLRLLNLQDDPRAINIYLNYAGWGDNCMSLTFCPSVSSRSQSLCSTSDTEDISSHGPYYGSFQKVDLSSVQPKVQFYRE